MIHLHPCSRMSCSVSRFWVRGQDYGSIPLLISRLLVCWRWGWSVCGLANVNGYDSYAALVIPPFQQSFWGEIALNSDNDCQIYFLQFNFTKQRQRNCIHITIKTKRKKETRWTSTSLLLHDSWFQGFGTLYTEIHWELPCMLWGDQTAIDLHYNNRFHKSMSSKVDKWTTSRMTRIQVHITIKTKRKKETRWTSTSLLLHDSWFQGFGTLYTEIHWELPCMLWGDQTAIDLHYNNRFHKSMSSKVWSYTV